MTVASSVALPNNTIPRVPSTIIEHTINNNLQQIKNTTQNQELEAFASYCRIFYLSSLTTAAGNKPDDNNSTSALHGNNIRHEVLTPGDDHCDDKHNNNVDKIEEARVVLQVLDDLCSGQQEKPHVVDVRYQHAVETCNLCSFGYNADECCSITRMGMLECYIRIRDRERSAAHRIQMRERQIALSDLLLVTTNARTGLTCLLSTISTSSSEAAAEEVCRNEKATSITDENRDAPKNKYPLTHRETIQSVTRAIREFVAAYQANIGAHPLIAGIQKLLEQQIKNDQFLLCWTISGFTLTENCKGGGNSDATGMQYMKDAVRVLLLFLDLVEYSDVARDDVEKDMDKSGSSSLAVVEEVVMRLQMKDGISNDTLKHLLSVLPDPRKLDARPTGLVSDSSVIRINSGGEMDQPAVTFLSWCLDVCVIS